MLQRIIVDTASSRVGSSENIRVQSARRSTKYEGHFLRDDNSSPIHRKPLDTPKMRRELLSQMYWNTQGIDPNQLLSI